jgi:DNA-binding transcriptional regulator GbsR (MarR family)
METTAEQRAFIEDMGHYMLGLALPRNTGRVYGYLLLRTEPASQDRIAADLGIAKSGASVAIRQLVQFGLARTISERGSRRLLYEALHNLDAILAARNTQVVELMERLRQGARVAPPGPGREGLEEMAEMLQEVVAEVPAMLERIRDRRRV